MGRFRAPDRCLQTGGAWLHFLQAEIAVGYDLIYGVGFKAPALALAVDRPALGWRRPVRCDPDGDCNARRRHAPRLAAVVRDLAFFLAPLGRGHPGRDVPRPQISPGS